MAIVHVNDLRREIGWTLSAYVRNAAAFCFDKAMIVVGYERNKEPGMKEMAN